MTFKHTKTSATFNVPKTNWVIWTSTDDETIAILQASNATFVSVECSNEFAGWCAPDLDGPITRSWHDIFLVKVNNIYSSAMSHEHTTQRDFLRWCHVPDSYRTILKLHLHTFDKNYLFVHVFKWRQVMYLWACDHHSIVESQMQNSFTMMN